MCGVVETFFSLATMYVYPLENGMDASCATSEDAVGFPLR